MLLPQDLVVLSFTSTDCDNTDFVVSSYPLIKWDEWVESKKDKVTELAWMITHVK